MTSGDVTAPRLTTMTITAQTPTMIKMRMRACMDMGGGSLVGDAKVRTRPNTKWRSSDEACLRLILTRTWSGALVQMNQCSAMVPAGDDSVSAGGGIVV